MKVYGIHAIVLVSATFALMNLQITAQVDSTDHPADCQVCQSARSLECSTCRGTGLDTQNCLKCKSSGQMDCLHCAPPVEKKEDNYVSPADQKRQRDLEELIRLLKIDIKTTPVPKEKPYKAGRLECPNKFCYGGKTLWESGKTDPCLLCKSEGTIKCSRCTSGKAACDLCCGKRKNTQVCGSCAGLGKLPCPRLSLNKNSDACVLCDGKPSRTCQICPSKKHLEQDCQPCLGTGSLPCETCLGTVRNGCATCASCGKVRIKLVNQYTRSETNGGITTCSGCEGKGFSTCKSCVRGMTTCTTCEGKKKILPPCSRTVKCACTRQGNVFGWELFGDLCRDAKNHSWASTMYTNALKSLATNPLPGVDPASKAHTQTEKRLREKLDRLPK